MRSVVFVLSNDAPESCRWSTWDVIRAGVESRPDLHTTLLEQV